jgi:hypothetical protein
VHKSQAPARRTEYIFYSGARDLWVLSMEFDCSHRFGARILMWLLDFWYICTSLGEEHWQTRCNELNEFHTRRDIYRLRIAG